MEEPGDEDDQFFGATENGWTNDFEPRTWPARITTKSVLWLSMITQVISILRFIIILVLPPHLNTMTSTSLYQLLSTSGYKIPSAPWLVASQITWSNQDVEAPWAFLASHWLSLWWMHKPNEFTGIYTETIDLFWRYPYSSDISSPSTRTSPVASQSPRPSNCSDLMANFICRLLGSEELRGTIYPQWRLCLPLL